jgi:hypothetical protein
LPGDNEAVVFPTTLVRPFAGCPTGFPGTTPWAAHLRPIQMPIATEAKSASLVKVARIDTKSGVAACAPGAASCGPLEELRRCGGNRVASSA